MNTLLELFVTSSVLILCILLIRKLARGHIPPALMYSLWLIVVLRLFVPFPLFQSPVSVMNAVERIPEIILETGPNIAVEDNVSTDVTPAVSDAKTNPSQSVTATRLDWDNLLAVVWLTGSIACAGWIGIVNLKLWRSLKSNRCLCGYDCPLTVWTVPGLPSPCLLGRGIYVPSDIINDSAVMRYAVAHEYAHYRQLDFIWTALRNLLVAVYWWNPLVWIAAYASREDGELSCDEAAIKSLGEAERYDYGRALVGMIAKGRGSNIVSAATTMHGSAKHIKERVQMISKKTKLFIPAVILIIIVAAVAVGCTFTGSDKANEQDNEAAQLQAQLEEALRKQSELEALISEQSDEKATLESSLEYQMREIAALKAQLEALDNTNQVVTVYELRFIEDDTFKVKISLPDGYVPEASSAATDTNNPRSGYDILLNGEKIGTLTYNYYDLYPDTEELPETRFAHMVYSEFFNQNIADWDGGYTPVKQNGTTHTATDRVQWSVPTGGGSRDEYMTANVLAYDDEVFVYVLISFDRNHTVEASELTYIAENLSIDAQTTMRREVYDYIAKEYDRVFKPYYDIYYYSMNYYREAEADGAIEATFWFTMNHAALDGSGTFEMTAHYKLVRDGNGAYTLYMDVGGNETTWEEVTIDELVSQ